MQNPREILIAGSARGILPPEEVDWAQRADWMEQVR
jgi:hypothetical protein